MKLERLKYSYSQVCNILHKYEEKAQENRSYNEALNIVTFFQKEILEALSDLSLTATNGVGGKAREERIHRATCRIISHERDASVKEPFSPDELLFEVSRVTTEILSSGAEKLDFTIFSNHPIQEDEINLQK